MSSKVLLSKNKGVSFHFKFPKQGLSLRSVAIKEDGLPELQFDAANCRDLPTLTEEDVATVARVVMEGKRPEFFYTPFTLPSHPFFNSGRKYKHYSPQWLRGTSVGDLLSEADWLMKCLHVGTRSNEEKTEFCSWQETSKLEGLAVHMDFPRENPGGSVLMSCKPIEIEENKNTILFVGEPKMTITDAGSYSYSKYITEYYDSVAYYDEPLFLKMQELMKLIVAAEWMKKKGIKFNETWLKDHTEKKKPQSKAVCVQRIENNREFVQQVATTLLLQDASITKQTMTGIEWTVTKPLSDTMKVVTTVRASMNDYDFLYEKFDCKEAVAFDHECKPIIPDVNSWSQLFAETVPIPLSVRYFHNNIGCETDSGGVSTANVGVRHTERACERVREPIVATVKDEEVVYTKTPERSTPIRTPPSSIPANTKEKVLNQAITKSTSHGFFDKEGGTLQSGNLRREMQTATVTTHSEVQLEGRPVAEQRARGKVFLGAEVTPLTNNCRSGSGHYPASNPQQPQIQNNPVVPSLPASTDSRTDSQSGDQEPPLPQQEEVQDVPIRPSIPSNHSGSRHQPVPPLELPPQEVPAGTGLLSPTSTTSSDSGVGSSLGSLSSLSSDDGRSSSSQPTGENLPYQASQLIFEGGVDMNDEDKDDEDSGSDTDTEVEKET